MCDKVKSLRPLLPVLLVLTLLAFAGLLALWLAMVGLGMQIGRDFEGLYALLWQLAVVAMLFSVVLVLLRPRWIAWSMLFLAYSFSAVLIVVMGEEWEQERRELNQRYAPARIAENQFLLENALIKADCADGITLTLNRKEFSDGDTVMSVSAIPRNRTHQQRLVVVLNNQWTEQLIRNLSTFRPRLEAYKLRGTHACQKNIDAMFNQLDSFARSKVLTRKG